MREASTYISPEVRDRSQVVKEWSLKEQCLQKSDASISLQSILIYGPKLHFWPFWLTGQHSVCRAAQETRNLLFQKSAFILIIYNIDAAKNTSSTKSRVTDHKWRRQTADSTSQQLPKTTETALIDSSDIIVEWRKVKQSVKQSPWVE